MLIAFGSNLGAGDYLQLPARAAEWPRALARVLAVRVNAENLMAGTEPSYLPIFHERDVAGNTYRAFVQADWFRQMRALGKQLILAAGANKPGDCDARIGLGLTLRNIKRVEVAGGVVDYILVDSPLSSSLNHCKATPRQAAEVFAHYIKDVRSVHPGVAVGFVDHASVHVGDWMDFIGELRRRGASPAFASIDIDRNALREENWWVRLWDLFLRRESTKTRQLRADLKLLFTWLNLAQIPSAVEIWGQGYRDAKSYRASVIPFAKWVRSLDPLPKALMVESWEIVDNARAIPHNLPESDPTSHTGIVNEVAQIFEGIE